MKRMSIISGLTSFLLLMNLVVPAHAEEGGFTVGRDNWCFGNRPALFPSEYTLPSEYEEILQSQLSNTEKKCVYELMQRPWGGACYGIALTNVLSYYNVIQPEMLDDNAASLYEVQPDERIASMIHYYFLMQSTTSKRQASAAFMYQKTEAERLQYLIDCVSSGEPALVCYMGDFFQAGVNSGHAVVAYGVEYGDFTYDDRQYDGRILIIDSNIVDFADDACIYFDSSDLSWHLPLYDLHSEHGDHLTQVISDVALLNDNGLIDGTDYRNDEEYFAILSTRELQSDYTVQKVLREDDAWVPQEDQTDVMKEFTSIFGTSLNTSENCFVMPDAESGYALCLEEPQTLDASMHYEDSLLMIDADSCTTSYFHPTGCIEFAGMDAAYTLEMVWNEGNYTESWYDFTVSGTADTASLQRTEDGYFLTSDNLRGISVTAKNDDVQANLIFSTDADSVLLCEVNETTLAAKIDTDGDGTYETAVRGVTLGDLNSDGNVNAIDASNILIAAANAAAGLESGLSEEQIVCADVNGDGNFNAVDASIVLMYGAYKGAGGELSFQEYLSGRA